MEDEGRSACSKKMAEKRPKWRMKGEALVLRRWQSKGLSGG